jgi:hypothetical protein
MLSAAVTVAPMAVSAALVAWRPSACAVLSSARARVCAAFFADRLRLASLRLRVAAAFWAAALRWFSVWIAMVAHLFAFFALSLPLTRPYHRDRDRNGESLEPCGS